MKRSTLILCIVIIIIEIVLIIDAFSEKEIKDTHIQSAAAREINISKINIWILTKLERIVIGIMYLR